MNPNAFNLSPDLSDVWEIQQTFQFVTKHACHTHRLKVHKLARAQGHTKSKACQRAGPQPGSAGGYRCLPQHDLPAPALTHN